MNRHQNKWTSTTEGRLLFNTIYSRHWAELLHCAENITQDREEAKDITAGAFCTLLERFDFFGQMHRIRPYLFAVVSNRSIDYLRKQMVIRRNSKGLKEFQLAQSDQIYFCDSNPVALVVEEIVLKIEMLPKGCAEVFKLSYLRQLTNIEIATKLSINEKTVRNQLSVARKILKELFVGQNQRGMKTLETLQQIYC